MDVWVKRNPAAPEGLFAWEAAGLRWLAGAESGVPCVRVLDQDATSLTLQKLEPAKPDPRAAHEFGRRLARTHAAAAVAFGAPPDGWTGPGYFGPTDHPLPMDLTGHSHWGGFYADERLAPMADLAGPCLDADARDALEKVGRRCRDGHFDGHDAPVRLHGDLWSGNVMWTTTGAVLIDPAAHGGHRETDLAMLALFGCPFYDAVIGGYQSERPLRAGWRRRQGLHQLHALLAHVVLFGRSYLDATSTAISSALSAEP